MIRKCNSSDFDAIHTVINDSAQAYKGVIPSDCWHEPYMPADELRQAIDDGVEFWGFEHCGQLVGVMGIQSAGDVTLIRHAYVCTACRRTGAGGELITFLLARIDTPALVGTWAAAEWAVRFYGKHGFRLVPTTEKDLLLRKYWHVSERQIEASVVLADARWIKYTRNSGEAQEWIRHYYDAALLPGISSMSQ